MKVCKKCGAEKALEDFGRGKRSKDGRLPRCKTCVNADARAAHARRMQDPAARARAQAKWRKYGEENREKRNLQARKWRAKNPDRQRKNNARARAKLLEADPDYFRRWYWNNLEAERERSRDFMRRDRQERPEAERERKQRYFERHPERVRNQWRENTHRRRALKGGTNAELAEFMALIVTMPCAYCGSKDRVTVDHVVPLSRGGKHEADNLAPACLSCNCSKGAKLLSEWRGPGRT